MAKTSSSYSKKGFGNGFISKVDRQAFPLKYQNSGPGPGAYNDQLRNLQNDLLKRFQQKSRTTKFYHDEVKKVDKKKETVIGPGTYDPAKLTYFQNTFKSSFKT